ncbi:FtsW/RodA/SpoVE family cell cycle protein [Amycolatopsis pigmentata]|uniref:peptidoglycan glycosyltransferase n=1 Tax=Amycolatopsis pigmentata TaxID=450801 RepID=A0ABW5G0Q0_9PSEU
MRLLSGPPRRTELALLGFALVVITAGMVLTDSHEPGDLVGSGLLLVVVFAVLCGAAHVAIRFFAPDADPLPLPCVALLNGIGLIMIHRIDQAYAYDAKQDGEPIPGQDAPRQLIWVAVAIVMFALVLFKVRDHRKLSNYTYVAGVLGLGLLVLPGVLPASLSEVNGAKLWLRLGPFSLQPGEFSKILIIVFASGFLVAKHHLFASAGKRFLGMELPRARDLGPLLVTWLASVSVVTFEKELGAALLFFGVALFMIYIATQRVSWILVGLALFVVGCVAAYYLFGHIRQRVSTWADPLGTYDRPGGGYQVSQSLFGLGTGGLTGTGLGQGRPDLVPFSSTDFISGAIGEELGTVGLLVMLLLYLMVTMRGLRAAMLVEDSYGKLLAAGLSCSLALQVFVVVGGVTGLIPLAGMTMPFLSYGGSSLLSNYLILALLLRVSSAAAKESAPPPPPPPKAAPLPQASTVLVNRPPSTS